MEEKPTLDLGSAIRPTRKSRAGMVAAIAVMSFYIAIASSAVVAQTSLAPSSWPAFRNNSQLTAQSIAAGLSNAELHWTAAIGRGQLTSPVVATDGTIYVSGFSDNQLYALNPDGSLKWSFQGSVDSVGSRFLAPPVVGRDGTIYVGASSGFLYAVSPAGEELWNRCLKGSINYSPIIGNHDTVFVVTQDCWLYAVPFHPDTTGDLRRYNLHALPYNTPAVGHDDFIYAIGRDSVVSLYLYLSERWKNRFGDVDTLQGIAIDSDSNLYLTALQNSAILSTDRNGNVRWRTDLPSGFGNPSLPAVGENGLLYFTSSQGGALFCLNAGDGSERWRFQDASGKFTSDPVLDADNHVYAVHKTRGLICLSEAGTLAWQMPEVSGRFSPALGADGTLYVSGTGQVFAVGRQRGAISVSPGNLDFGLVCSETDSTLQVEVQNVGEGALTVSGYQSTDSAFTIDTSEFPFTLERGEFKRVGVTFMPRDTITYQATITFISDAREGNATVTVQGRGDSPAILLTAMPDSLGRLCLGDKAEVIVTVANPSNCLLRVDSIEIESSTATNVLTQSANGSRVLVKSIEIEPGDSFSFPVSIDAEAFGPVWIKVTVWSNATNVPTPTEVIIPGIVVPPVIAAQDTIYFPNTAINDTSSAAGAIWNAGSCPLTISSFEITGPNAASFSLADLDTPVILNADDTITVPVRFHPHRVGTHQARLLVYSDDPVHNPLVIELIGESMPLEPGIKVSPDTLTYSLGCVDSVASLELTIKNIGLADLVVDSITFSSPVFTYDSSVVFSFILQPHSERVVSILFRPDSSGFYTAIGKVHSNATFGDSTFELNGEVDAPKLELTAMPPSFGEICFGQIARTKLCMINPTTCDLKVDSFRVDLESVVEKSDPPVDASGKVGFIIPAGGEFCLTVSKTPQTLGDFAIKLTVWSSAEGNPVDSVVVKGTVISPAIAGDDTVDFGTVVVGDSAQQNALITNASACSLRIDSLTIIGSSGAFDFVDKPATPLLIDPSGSLSVGLKFKPAESIEYADTLRVWCNDQSQPVYDILLLGNGADSIEVVIDPTSLDFGKACVGESREMCFAMTNHGTTSVIVDEVQVPAPVFVTEVVEFQLPPDSTKLVCIKFAPGAPGTFSGEAVIIARSGHRWSVPLTGVGVTPTLTANEIIAFPNTEVNSTSTLEIAVRGDSRCDARVDTLIISGQHASDFGVASVTLPRPIPADDSLSLSVSFTPIEIGLREAELWVVWRNAVDAVDTLEIALSGNGLSGVLATCDSIKFQPTCLNAIDTTTCTIQNTGTADLLVLDVRLVGGEDLPHAQFPFKLEPSLFEPLPRTLQAGKTMAVTVLFEPTVEGSFGTQLAILTESALQKSHSVSLPVSGVGLPASPVMAVDRTWLSFSAPLDRIDREELTVKNRGCGPLVIENLRLLLPIEVFSIGLVQFNRQERSKIVQKQNRGNYLITFADSLTLHIGDSVNIEVQFVGHDFTTYSGELYVKSQNEEIRIDLSGAVEDNVPCMVLSEPAHDFGEVRIGSKETWELVINNTSDDGRLFIDSAYTKTADFTLQITEFQVFPNNPYPLNVTFEPKAIGVRLDTLCLRTNVQEDAEPVCGAPLVKIPLRGVGVGRGKADVYAMPNAFTPNDDHRNDVAKVHYPEHDLEEPLLRVFTVRGLEVRVVRQKQATLHIIEWDGRNEDGKLQLPGVYLWILEDRGTKIQSGQFALIR